ncbi:MAG TPA: amidohydrolase family protein [Verrucomicrobiae bacterium]
MKFNRRHFLGTLASSAAAAITAPFLRPAKYARLQASVPLVDMHVHLFGVLEKNGCWLSKTQSEHWTHPFFMKLLGLDGQEDQDEVYVQRLVAMLRGSSLNRCVLQAWDGRVDGHGKVDREATTTLLVPNDYMFRIVRRYPDLFIPCASINPYRVDALDELARCAELGARMVKIHPPTMDVDPNKLPLKDFYRLCQARRVLVMVHTGNEHGADIVGLHNCDPIKLRLALDEGCTVIAAHAGTGQFYDRERHFASFVKLIERYPNLYCDNSVMAAMLRWRNVPEMLAHAGVLERMVHGGDFPFPPNGLAYWNRLPPRLTARLAEEKNLFERDVQLKLALGIPQSVFERGARLLGLA